MEQQIDYKFL